MKRILIVDDQAGWRDFNTSAVYDVLGENAVVVTASSAQEAYNKLLENTKSPFDVIFTDMQMEEDYAPLMAGEWFIEQIKTLSSYLNTQVIIVSASPKIKHIAERYSVDYIPKRLAVLSLEPYKELLKQKNG